MKWKDVDGFAGYRVSSEGAVESRMLRNGAGLGRTWRPIRFKRKSCGHMYARLRRGGKVHYVHVHKLVLEAFVGPRPAGMECCHGDGNPKNNRLENLRWGTHAENMADMIAHGTSNRGERHFAAKLRESDVVAIRRMAAAGGVQQKRLAEQFGVSKSQISRVVRHVDWPHISANPLPEGST